MTTRDELKNVLWRFYNDCGEAEAIEGCGIGVPMGKALDAIEKLIEKVRLEERFKAGVAFQVKYSTGKGEQA